MELANITLPENKDKDTTSLSKMFLTFASFDNKIYMLAGILAAIIAGACLPFISFFWGKLMSSIGLSMEAAVN